MKGAIEVVDHSSTAPLGPVQEFIIPFGNLAEKDSISLENTDSTKNQNLGLVLSLLGGTFLTIFLVYLGVRNKALKEHWRKTTNYHTLS